MGTEAATRSLPRQTMSGQVAEDLRRRILSGELPEGHQLKQEQLASEFGISKVPVREALSQLEAEGFVIQQFHRGAVVAGLSADQVMELFELRSQIEGWLLELAMGQATDSDLRAIEVAAAELEHSDDPAMLPTLNRIFHEALYRPAGKTFAIDMVRKMHDQLDRYVRLQFSVGRQKQEAVKEHYELFRLYRNRDPAARDLLCRHILASAGKLKIALNIRKEGDTAAR